MPNLSNNVTFLFASDGSLASEGLSVFLQTKTNFLMLAECSDGESTITAIEAHSPEIAVIDAQLPDMAAGQIIEAVRTRNSTTKIIVLGASADRAAADRLIAAGADAYIVRNGPSRHLNDAIRYVRDGGKYVSPQLTGDVQVTAVQAADDTGETVLTLRNAVEAQARTVEKLENAMDRAQHAIELLQQKVEQLTGAPVEPAASVQNQPPDRNRVLTTLRSNVGAVAAAMIVGVLGFMLAGILHPAPASSLAEFATLGAEDALKPGSTPSLHLSGWETETVNKASGLLRSQQYAAAEKLCRSLLKQNPANAAASRVLASALFHQNKIEESADVVRSMAVPTNHAVPPGHKLSFQN